MCNYGSLSYLLAYLRAERDAQSAADNETEERDWRAKCADWNQLVETMLENDSSLSSHPDAFFSFGDVVKTGRPASIAESTDTMRLCATCSAPYVLTTDGLPRCKDCRIAAVERLAIAYAGFEPLEISPFER